MCHSRQAQIRILWDMAEQVCVPGQAGNTRTWLLRDEEQRLQVWSASGHYGQKLWKQKHTSRSRTGQMGKIQMH